MKDSEAKAIEIIEKGEPFDEHWFDEGDVESGPMGGTLFGYRHGEDVLQLTRNGSVLLYLDAETIGIGRVIYNSSTSFGRDKWYTGIGAMIKDHLTAISRNATRNGLEFVRTGKHPSEGYFSLDNIIAREEALRSQS